MYGVSVPDHRLAVAAGKDNALDWDTLTYTRFPLTNASVANF